MALSKKKRVGKRTISAKQVRKVASGRKRRKADGTQPPNADWGVMLSSGREYLRDAPWLGFFPGLAILFTVLAFNLFGDGLRDALDPRMQ